nr:MAG TPA: hypothetical protein [Caudoviricetes sp.]
MRIGGQTIRNRCFPSWSVRTRRNIRDGNRNP